MKVRTVRTVAVAAAVVLAVGAVTLWRFGGLAGSQHVVGGKPSVANRPGPVISTSPAQIIPTFSGIVDRIDGGYLYLKDVTYSLGRAHLESSPEQPETKQPDTLPTEQRVPVPDGRWLTATHWHSTDGTVDLFRGQAVTYFIDSKVIMPDLHFIRGRVTAVAGDTLTVQVEEIQNDAGEGPQTVVTHVGQAVTLRWTPRARARDLPQGQSLQPGNEVLLGWFGEAGAQLVWQLAILG